MRPVRIIAVSMIAAVGLVMAGCSSNDEPATSDAAASTSATPTDQSSESPSDSSSSGAPADVGDFAEVDGYTLVPLPKAARSAFASAVGNAPQIQGFEGRLVEKDGQQTGMVIRVQLDADQASLPDFEKQFLPGFASGIAGSSAAPDFQEINGVNVVKIGTPDGTGTAYAWIQDSVATVLVFQDSADAQTYAEGALS